MCSLLVCRLESKMEEWAGLAPCEAKGAPAPGPCPGLYVVVFFRVCIISLCVCIWVQISPFEKDSVCTGALIWGDLSYPAGGQAALKAGAAGTWHQASLSTIILGCSLPPSLELQPLFPGYKSHFLSFLPCFAGAHPLLASRKKGRRRGKIFKYSLCLKYSHSPHNEVILWLSIHF